MKKLILTTSFILVSILLNAQAKVWPGGYTAIGYTVSAPTSGYIMQVSGNTLFTSGTATVSSGGARITGTTTTTGASNPDYTWNGDANTGFFRPASSSIGFAVGGTDKMRLTTTGLGIGSTSPGCLLDVRSSTTTTAGFLSLSNSDASKFLGLYNGAAANDNQAIYWPSGQTLRFGVGGNYIAATFTETVRMQSNGSVGVGTGSSITAQTKLDVLFTGTAYTGKVYGGRFVNSNTTSGTNPYVYPILCIRKIE